MSSNVNFNMAPVPENTQDWAVGFGVLNGQSCLYSTTPSSSSSSNNSVSGGVPIPHSAYATPEFNFSTNHIPLSGDAASHSQAQGFQFTAGLDSGNIYPSALLQMHAQPLCSYPAPIFQTTMARPSYTCAPLATSDYSTSHPHLAAMNAASGVLDELYPSALLQRRAQPFVSYPAQAAKPTRGRMTYASAPPAASFYKAGPTHLGVTPAVSLYDTTPPNLSITDSALDDQWPRPQPPFQPTSAPTLPPAKKLRIDPQASRPALAASTAAISSFASARAWKNRVLERVMAPALPEDIHSNTQHYVDVLYKAMKNMETAEDGERVLETGKLKRKSPAFRMFQDHHFDEKDVVAACWLLVETLIKLHQEGSHLRACQLPEPLRHGPSELELAFMERFNAVKSLLETEKMAAKDVIDGGEVESMRTARCPLSIKRDKSTYRRLNDRRPSQSAGRLAAEGGEGDTAGPRKRRRVLADLSE